MAIRISLPIISVREGMLEFSARVQSEALPPGVPERLTFSVTHDSGMVFSERSDAFLVAVVPLAMKLGQDIELEGKVSTRLAQGIATYQDILSTWWPDLFQPINVSIKHLDARKEESRPDGVGCCFSGGIDSFNAIMELRPPLNRFPEFAITHAMMINGFDQITDLEQTGVSQQMYDVYSKVLEPWDIQLVMIHSNLKLFRDAMFIKKELVRSFGSSLTACAHALAPVFGRFNLSGHATYQYPDLVPSGSHPALDHHLSSDQLQIIHLGARLSRSEKLEMMASQAPVRQALRVCFRHPEFAPDTGDVLNCGVCEKCIRTIIMLEIIGQLEQFPTFSNRRHINAYKDPKVLPHIPTMFLEDLITLAERHGRDEWLALFKQAIATRKKIFAQV